MWETVRRFGCPFTRILPCDPLFLMDAVSWVFFSVRRCSVPSLLTDAIVITGVFTDSPQDSQRHLLVRALFGEVPTRRNVP